MQVAQDLARAGFLAVAGCWFSGSENPNREAPRDAGPASSRKSAIPCPEVPPLGPGAYPEAVQYIDGLVQAARALPGARPDRLALVGHSRGGAEGLRCVLAQGDVQASFFMTRAIG